MEESQHRLDLPELNRVNLRTQSKLIAEQGRPMSCVGGAACEAEQGDVINVGERGLVALAGIAKTKRKEARPECSFHRVAGPQIGSDGQRGDEFSQTKLLVHLVLAYHRYRKWLHRLTDDAFGEWYPDCSMVPLGCEGFVVGEWAGSTLNLKS